MQNDQNDQNEIKNICFIHVFKFILIKMLDKQVMHELCVLLSGTSILYHNKLSSMIAGNFLEGEFRW